MKRKLFGAIASGLVFICYFAFIFVLLLVSGVISGDIPLFYFIMLLVIFSVPLIGVIAALRSRVNEILAGEEEEAKKY